MSWAYTCIIPYYSQLSLTCNSSHETCTYSNQCVLWIVHDVEPHSPLFDYFREIISWAFLIDGYDQCIHVLWHIVHQEILKVVPYQFFISPTIQHKYFKGYKFHEIHGFHCFPAKRKNYFRKNEWTPIVTGLNYACNLFPAKSKFWQICKIYSPGNICAVWYVHSFVCHVL